MEFAGVVVDGRLGEQALTMFNLGGTGALAQQGLDLTAVDPVYALPAPLYPGHTIERQARRHPYAETLLAQLPPGWRGHFRAGAYEQGFEGCGGGLDLRRWDGPAGLPLSAWGLPAPMP